MAGDCILQGLGHQNVRNLWRPVAACGRLWQLDYVHCTGAARLDGARAVAGRCGGGVCGVRGASNDARCDAMYAALSVLYVCLYVSVRAPHPLSVRLRCVG